MLKTCSRCGTRIPMVASRCPNCTSELDTGSGPGEALGIILIALLMIIFYIVDKLGCTS